MACLMLTKISALAVAQETGTIVGRTPGSAIGARITSTAVVPIATCNSPAASAAEASGGPLVPEMVFSRKWGELVCIRHQDGHTEQLRSDNIAGVASADGKQVAYWIEAKHELRVASASQHADTLIEALPGATFRQMIWSQKGHTLSYFPNDPKLPGIRAIDVDSGQRKLFSGSFVALVASPDPEHVVAVAGDGVERLAIADGKREVLATVKYASAAKYSHSGKRLGILANAPAAEAPAAATGNAPDSSADDDGPDCTGGAFFLIVQDAATNQLLDVPFPKGFDTVLDFSFSPDDRAITVTFGVVGCDYPGERAQIYLVSLPDLRLTPLSPEDRMSVQPEWTPDGKALVYVDYRGSDSPLVAFDLQTHKIRRLTNPGQYFGPDAWVSWR